MGATNFQSIPRFENGCKVGSAGTTITKIEKGTVSLTVTTLAAAAEEDLTAAITGVQVGDVILLTPREAAAETGLALLGAWVSDTDEITVRIGNTHTDALTGGANTWDYVLIRS